MKRVPEGVFPHETRPGFGRTEIKSSVTKRAIDQHYRNAPVFKGLYPDYAFKGIWGAWEPPILITEDRRSVARASARRSYLFLGSMIGAGILGLIFPLGMGMPPLSGRLGQLCLVGGVATVIMGVLFALLERSIARHLRSEGPFESKVWWKTVGPDAPGEALEEYLKLKGWSVVGPRREGALTGEQFVRYDLPKGLYLKSTYHEREDGGLYAYVALGYPGNQAKLAQEIQRELDSFLSEKDMIQLVGPESES